VKSTFEIIAPMDGTISAINDALNEDLELLSSDPLDEGWIYKIRVAKSDTDEDDGESEE
jgi:glycine cleavage system H protein